MSKTIKLISFIILILFLCPSQYLFIPFFVIGALVFVIRFLRNNSPTKSRIDTTVFLVSIILNLFLAVVFMHKWGQILGSDLTLILAVLFAFGGTPATACLISELKISPLSVQLRTSDKLSVTEILICAVTSISIMLFATHSSPLVPFNDYCDAIEEYGLGTPDEDDFIEFIDMPD